MDVDKCWDEIVKIGVIPASKCRSIYININFTSLLLISIIYILYGIYLKMFTGFCYRMYYKPWNQVVVWSVWSLTSLFPVFYSAEMLFMYINDHFFQLLMVQIIFSVLQLCQIYGTFILLNSWASDPKIIETNSYLPLSRKLSEYNVEDQHESSNNDLESQDKSKMKHSNPQMGYQKDSYYLQYITIPIISLTLFKLSFNFTIEASASGTVWLRNALFVLGDIVVFCIWGYYAKKIFFSKGFVMKIFMKQMMPIIFGCYFLIYIGNVVSSARWT